MVIILKRYANSSWEGNPKSINKWLKYSEIKLVIEICP